MSATTTEHPCLLCTGHYSPLLESFPRGLRVYMRCSNCGLIAEDPTQYDQVDFDLSKTPDQLDDHDRKAFHDRYGESIQVAQDDGELYKLYDYDDPQEMRAAICDRVDAHIKSAHLPERLTVVEVGCADGFLLRELQRRRPGTTVMGIDPSPVSFEQGSKHGTPMMQGTLETVDAARLPTADVAIALGNLMLHENPVRTLELMAATTKPNGIIVFDVKNSGCLARASARHLARTPLKRLRPVRNYVTRNFMNFRYGFDRKTVVDLTRAAGLELEELQSVPPRAIAFANQHRGSNGVAGTIWRLMDAVDRRNQNQAWLEVRARVPAQR